eukprot:GILK01000393.1.p1 GENE.GILK01000393.1~~GILK01000393.1.p1  ORF type:complete len:517 (-),score=107.85 GILK01000393.1:91-1641(-)
MKATYLCLFLLFGNLCATLANPPTGAKVTFSKTGIDNMKNAAIPLIAKTIGEIRIPDQQTSLPLAITAYLRDISLKNLNMDAKTTEVSCVTSHTILVAVRGISADLHFTWAYKNLLWGDSGWGVAQVRGASLTATATLGRNADGSASVNVDSGNIDMGQVDLHVDVGVWSKLFGWLIDWFVTTVKNTVMGQVKDQINAQFKAIANQMAADLIKTVPLTLVIPSSPLAIDYALTDAISCTADYLTVPFQAMFFDNTKAPTPAPIPEPAPLPDTVANPADVDLFLSQYAINSAAYVLYSVNYLSYSISQSLIPPEVSLKLRTEEFAELLPGMDQKWPNHDFDLHCKAIETPQVTFTEGLVYADIAGSCAFFIKPEQVTAVEFKTSLKIKIEVHIDNYKLMGKFDEASLGPVTVGENNIGDFSTDDVYALFNFLVQAAIPQISARLLEQGIDLPHPSGAGLANPALAIKDGYITVSGTPTLPTANLQLSAAKAVAQYNEKQSLMAVVQAAEQVEQEFLN